MNFFAGSNVGFADFVDFYIMMIKRKIEAFLF